MNWGVKILLTLVTIVVVTVSVGIYMVSKDNDSLIEEGYYEKGLSYESVIEHKRNVQLHNAQPQITIKENYIEVLFNEGSNKGEITLRRPSDQDLDKTIPFTTLDKKYTLSLSSIQSGAWEINLSWEQNNIPFFYTKRVFIP